MAFNPYQFGYGNPYAMAPQAPMQYAQPAQDQLAQLRQMQQAPQPMQAPQMPPQQTGDMIWVQGEAAAKAYMVAPGSRVVLWDSENPVVYIKSMDASGIPSPLKILDYTERPDAPQTAAGPRRRSREEYVTRAEFDALAAKLDALTTTKEAIDNAESAV